jgi:hypothetical protein
MRPKRKRGLGRSASVRAQVRRAGAEGAIITFETSANLRVYQVLARILRNGSDAPQGPTVFIDSHGTFGLFPPRI